MNLRTVAIVLAPAIVGTLLGFVQEAFANRLALLVQTQPSLEAARQFFQIAGDLMPWLGIATTVILLGIWEYIPENLDANQRFGYTQALATPISLPYALIVTGMANTMVPVVMFIFALFMTLVPFLTPLFIHIATPRFERWKRSRT